jgi:hypothetical protein
MDWTSKIPPYESQYSATTHTDAQDCIAESLCHIVYMMTGRRYSPRALALMSGTTEAGNDVNDVLEAANTKGLIPYELWPTPDSFTWDSYYAPIPADVLAKAEKLAITLIAADLDKSPLWTELEWGANLPVPTRHMVAQISATQYFDSEQGAPIKPITYENAIIAYKTSIKINKPPMNTYVQTMNYNGTIGIFVPVSDPTQVPVLNNLFNVAIVVNADGTIPTQKTVVDK